MLWTRRVFLTLGKVHFFSGFHCISTCFPESSFPPAPLRCTLPRDAGVRITHHSLAADTSPPAGERRGPGRSLGRRKRFNSGKLEQQALRALNQLSTTFQPHFQEKAHEQVCLKQSFSQSRKKHGPYSHFIFTETLHQSQPLLRQLSITFLPAPFVSEQTETPISFLLMQ